MDALQFLKEDHDRVRDLLQRMLATNAEQIDLRHQLFELLRQELEVHARLEEDLFYPAMDRQGRHEHEKVEESLGEHHWVQEALSQLDHVDPSDAAWTIRLKEISRHVEAHVRDEEGDLFPRARDEIGDELASLGERMAQERDQLLRTY